MSPSLKALKKIEGCKLILDKVQSPQTIFLPQKLLRLKPRMSLMTCDFLLYLF